MKQDGASGLSSHEAIRQALARYCRGVDRIDGDMIASAYWPGARDDHLVFAGTVEEFVPWVIGLLREDTTTSHFLGQSMIWVEGGKAEVETYFQSWNLRDLTDGEAVNYAVGRYLDEFEERNGEWRISNRRVVLDFTRAAPLGPKHPEAPVAGRHGSDDPSFAALPNLSLRHRPSSL